MFCTQCGNEVQANANFCEKCGHRLSRERIQQAQPGTLPTEYPTTHRYIDKPAGKRIEITPQQSELSSPISSKSGGERFRWITLSKEAAAAHPYFGIKGFAAFFRGILVVVPGLWFFNSIGVLMDLVRKMGSFTVADYLVMAPTAILCLWSCWNASLLGKQDRRFYASFFAFLALCPFILISGALLWASASARHLGSKYWDSSYMFLIGWALCAALAIAYVLLSKRINLTLKHRVRASDPEIARLKT